VGVLKGFDQLVNIVLDETVEILQAATSGAAAAAGSPSAPATRNLGLIVCRGPNITVVCPDDGMREIDNPFVAGGDEE
jgi:U6 snRNA-associated Sm-like protein LSm7